MWAGEKADDGVRDVVEMYAGTKKRGLPDAIG